MADKARRPRNSTSISPAGIDDARRMARIRAVQAAPLWGMTPEQLRRRCVRGEITGASKIGNEWWIIPKGLDDYFTKQKRVVR